MTDEEFRSLMLRPVTPEERVELDALRARGALLPRRADVIDFTEARKRRKD